MKKWLKLTIRYLLFAVVSVIVGVNIYTAISAKLAGNAVPMPFGIGTSVVMSGSMEPNLSVGDIIIVKESETYEVGDIIVFQDGSSATVHRIVAIDEKTFTTKGDANNTKDSPISKECVYGTVVTAIPYVGYIALFIKSLPGTLAIIALAIILLNISFRREKKKDDEQIDEIKEEIQKLLNEKK